MDVTKHIERAEKEAGRKNFDLAISLFDQILSLDPDNGRARTGKRRAELKKYAKGYPSSLTRGIKNLGPRLGMMLGKTFRASGMVARMAEKALGNDPKNVGLNLTLGHALLKSGHRSGAESAFAVVAEFDPNDVESLKTLGRLYYEGKKWDDALECYERALKVSPRDQEAIKMRKNLAAEGAIKTGGFEQAKSSRDVAKSQAQLDEIERRQKLVKSEDDIAGAVRELKDKIDADATDVDAWSRLGSLHYQQRELDAAKRCFEKVVELRPDDNETAARLGDVRLLELDTKIKEARQDYKDGIDGADDRMRRLVRERRAIRVEEFTRRVAVHPTDTALRFKLGHYLLDNDQVDEAIAEFQIAVKDPRRKYQSMTMLGRAFLKKGMGDLAIKQLEGALEGFGGVNEKSLEIVYSLGAAHEQNGDFDRALSQFSRIYEIDISFKDVAKKIDVLKEKIAS